MCTSIGYNNGTFYFGRNLDLDYHFNEEVAIMPRNYELHFKSFSTIKSHYAMIGMAFVCDDYPLYAEAVNEKGLAMAGLNFPGYAKFDDFEIQGKDNITPYEIISWILAQCSNLEEAKDKLKNLHFYSTPFKEGLGVNPLHWIIADSKGAVTVECSDKGLVVYDNPVSVLTNSPHFEYHMLNLNNYLGFGSRQPENNLTKNADLKAFGQGLGAFGIPGDNSPASRFIRVTYSKENSNIEKKDDLNVIQFFHILDSVKVVKGNVVTPEGMDEFTIYSCCVNTETGDYYYKTYTDPSIRKISMSKVDLNSKNIFRYSISQKASFIEEN